jgi:tripartite ATP-independent transporter DctM subunit
MESTQLLLQALFLFGFLLVLLLGGVWIAFSLGCVAWVGFAFFTDNSPAVNLFQSLWGSSASATLASLPLFIWMGEILFRSKLSEQMFAGISPWLGWIPGRLMHVNVLASGVFGSVSGSSAATCATVAKVALPELLKRGYDEKTCLGSLCGAGTLGILIPPSIIMVVYAVAAEVSILDMFLAGIIPGFIVMVLFSGYIVVWALLNPGKVPLDDIRMSLIQRLWTSRHLIPIMLLMVFVAAVMMAGWSTATEAAAYGVAGSLVIAGLSGGLSRQVFWDSVMAATKLSCMIMFILAGAAFLTASMAFTGIPKALAEWVASLNPDRLTIIAILAFVYLLLGAALDGVSMIVLTTSVVLPVIERVGIDLVWFGIFIILMVEIAEVTPPLGFNMFILMSMSGRDMTYLAKASFPFFSMLLFAVVLLTAFPGIATWLPSYTLSK